MRIIIAFLVTFLTYLKCQEKGNKPSSDTIFSRLQDFRRLISHYKTSPGSKALRQGYGYVTYYDPNTDEAYYGYNVQVPTECPFVQEQKKKAQEKKRKTTTYAPDFYEEYPNLTPGPPAKPTKKKTKTKTTTPPIRDCEYYDFNPEPGDPWPPSLCSSTMGPNSETSVPTTTAKPRNNRPQYPETTTDDPDNFWPHTSTHPSNNHQHTKKPHYSTTEQYVDLDINHYGNGDDGETVPARHPSHHPHHNHPHNPGESCPFAPSHNPNNPSNPSHNPPYDPSHNPHNPAYNPSQNTNYPSNPSHNPPYNPSNNAPYDPTNNSPHDPYNPSHNPQNYPYDSFENPSNPTNNFPYESSHNPSRPSHNPSNTQHPPQLPGDGNIGLIESVKNIVSSGVMTNQWNVKEDRNTDMEYLEMLNKNKRNKKKKGGNRNKRLRLSGVKKKKPKAGERICILNSHNEYCDGRRF